MESAYEFIHALFLYRCSYVDTEVLLVMSKSKQITETFQQHVDTFNEAMQEYISNSRLAIADKILAYETGELNEKESIGLFQYLVDTGMVHSLQGHYGRTAAMLIEAGVITPKREEG